MMFLKTLTWFLLLQCCIIATLYQFPTCLAEEQSGHTTTETLQPKSSDCETILSPRQQCTNSIHGVPGIPGIPGSQGPAGPAGVKGQDGLTGPKGDKGDPGQKGSEGRRGQPGPRGEWGQRGQKGDKGHAGEIQQPRYRRIALSVERISPLGPVSGHTTVLHDNVISNIGNAYNTSTGVFTCPVNGVYFFMISAIRKRATDLDLCLIKNGTQQCCAYMHDPNETTDFVGTASGSDVLELQQGDEIWVKLWSGHATGRTSLVGFILF